MCVNILYAIIHVYMCMYVYVCMCDLCSLILINEKYSHTKYRKFHDISYIL